MTKVIIESPYAATEEYTREDAIEYLNRCMRDSLKRGEAFIASHAIYTPFLDDNDLKERKHGINLGYEWMEVADLVVFYDDWGISDGMKSALQKASSMQKKVEFRSIGREGEAPKDDE